MCEYFYSYQYTDEGEEKEEEIKFSKNRFRQGQRITPKEKMKAQIDKGIIGEQRIKGLKLEMKGRIRGKDRKQKKVARYGGQDQQDILSRIDYAMGEVRTKYGVMGIKVQSAKERVKRSEERIK